MSRKAKRGNGDLACGDGAFKSVSAYAEVDERQEVRHDASGPRLDGTDRPGT